MTSTSPATRRVCWTVIAGAVTLAMSGCASAPLLQKHASDVRTTALFREPCLLPPPADEPRQQEAASMPSYAMIRGKEGGQTEPSCDRTSMETMVDRFMTIQEADEEQGIRGDTMETVREKGFTIYLDARRRTRRPNTRLLHGTEALAAVGMAVSPPPLQKPEEVKAYTEFMGQHYAEEYVERDVRNVVDRFYVNRKDSFENGDDRVFAILWRGGRVIKRVIKGGPVDNPKQERGFLLGPSTFIIDTLTGSMSSAAKALSPIK